MIVEGILLLHDPQLREKIDIKIFVDTPLPLCLQRRIDRDTIERGRSPQSVRDQFEANVKPMYEKFVQPTRSFADVIIDGSTNNSLFIEMLTNHLRSTLNRPNQKT